MTKQTKTTKKTVTAKKQLTLEAATPVVVSGATQADQDAKNALLIVSLAINMFIFIGWIALQVTTAYDYQVAALLFTR